MQGHKNIEPTIIIPYMQKWVDFFCKKIDGEKTYLTPEMCDYFNDVVDYAYGLLIYKPKIIRGLDALELELSRRNNAKEFFTQAFEFFDVHFEKKVEINKITIKQLREAFAKRLTSPGFTPEQEEANARNRLLNTLDRVSPDRLKAKRNADIQESRHGRNPHSSRVPHMPLKQLSLEQINQKAEEKQQKPPVDKANPQKLDAPKPVLAKQSLFGWLGSIIKTIVFTTLTLGAYAYFIYKTRQDMNERFAINKAERSLGFMCWHR